MSSVSYDDAPTPLTDRERTLVHRMFSDFMEVPGEWKTALKNELERDPPVLGVQTLGVKTSAFRGPAGPTGPTGPAGPPGPSGTASFVTGSGPPTSGVGANGSVYLDYTNLNFWGPKVSGAWPSTPFGRLMPIGVIRAGNH